MNGYSLERTHAQWRLAEGKSYHRALYSTWRAVQAVYDGGDRPCFAYVRAIVRMVYNRPL
jgi:hypothetical protein